MEGGKGTGGEEGVKGMRGERMRMETGDLKNGEDIRGIKEGWG